MGDNCTLPSNNLFSMILTKNVEAVIMLLRHNSMLPHVQDGDIIPVRKQPSADSGSYFVVLIDDENGVVKKVKFDAVNVTLILTNPNYPSRTFAGVEPQRIQVLGEVLQIINTLKRG